jgi:ADP-ribosylglycohydrolase
MSRLVGALLGTAVGDALGLPMEGLRPATIARRFGRVDRFRLLGSIGFVSDDTEQSALVAQSLAQHPSDPAAAARAFRRSLVGWLLRLPWGIGLATLRACVRALLGFRISGVRSAGNGAAMRAGIIGVLFARDPDKRRSFTTALTEVTHTDARAVEGALFVAALAASCARAEPEADRRPLFDMAASEVHEASLAAGLREAADLADRAASVPEAAKTLGTTGFVIHTVPFAAFCFLRCRTSTLDALSEAISAGGDTDSIAAILGGWLGALGDEAGLPGELVRRLNDGPFGPTHLRALGACLEQLQTGHDAPVPTYSTLLALARNVALFPVVLAHGVRHLVRL